MGLLYLLPLFTLYITLNIQKFYVLLTQCIYALLRISEQAAIISLYNVKFLIIMTQKECVYCAVRAKSPNVNG